MTFSEPVFCLQFRAISWLFKGLYPQNTYRMSEIYSIRDIIDTVSQAGKLHKKKNLDSLYDSPRSQVYMPSLNDGIPRLRRKRTRFGILGVSYSCLCIFCDSVYYICF